MLFQTTYQQKNVKTVHPLFYSYAQLGLLKWTAHRPNRNEHLRNTFQIWDAAFVRMNTWAELAFTVV